MNTRPCKVPSRRRDSWAVPETAVACFDAARDFVAEGEIEKAIRCADRCEQMIGRRVPLVIFFPHLEARIRALTDTANRMPRAARILRKEIEWLQEAERVLRKHHLSRKPFRGNVGLDQNAARN